MSIESGKNLAGIGAILLIIPAPFLGIIGIILVLIGMKNLSQAYKDESIWKNTLYAFVFGIIGIAASGFTLLSLFFGGLFSFSSGVTQATGLAGFFAGLILSLVIAFIFLILEAIYLRRAFDSLANKSGVNLFRTGGLLFLIGAVLTIILIGLFLIFIAWILILVAFFQIPNTQMQQQSQMSSPYPPMSLTSLFFFLSKLNI